MYERAFDDIPNGFHSLQALDFFFANYSRPRHALRNRGSAVSENDEIMIIHILMNA